MYLAHVPVRMTEVWVARSNAPFTEHVPRNPAPKMEVDPTFHEFASDWYATKELEVEPNTANHYRNDLTNTCCRSSRSTASC